MGDVIGKSGPRGRDGAEDLSQGSEVFLAILTPHCGQGTLGGSQHLDWAIQLNHAHLSGMLMSRVLPETRRYSSTQRPSEDPRALRSMSSLRFRPRRGLGDPGAGLLHWAVGRVCWRELERLV